MVIGPGWWKRWPSVAAPQVDAVDRDRHDLLAEQGDDRMQRPHPAQAGGRRRRRAPAHRLGPLEIADDSGDRLGQHRRRCPARPVDHREPDAVAVLELVLVQPGLAQEAFERLRRRCRLGPFNSSRHRRRFQRQALARSAPAAAGSSKSSIPSCVRPAAGQRLGHHPRQVVARLGLHPRRDFLATAVRAGSRAAHAAYPL